MLKTQERRNKRHIKIRAKISGSADAPRLCVFKSSKHIYAQLIDDVKGKTIAAFDDSALKGKKTKTKTNSAFEVGKSIAKAAALKKIEKVVFDRGGYRYHGRIKALADGAREGGLKF